MEEKVLKGHCASGGFARGRIALFLDQPGAYKSSRSVDEEKLRLETALKTAQTQLLMLKSNADELGAQLLDFQIELINDDQLTDPVFDLIHKNYSAYAAWCIVLDEQINDYHASTDEMFRSRAYDFIDLKDRIISILQPDEKISTENFENMIYVAKKITPSRFLEIDWNRYCGIALGMGSAASHVAMLARSRKIPMIFGIGSQLLSCEHKAEAILDADQGRLYQYPSNKTVQMFKKNDRSDIATDDVKFIFKSAVTASGERILIYINVDDNSLLEDVNPQICDGIGLVRTEMMFSQLPELPDEETQYSAYCKLLAWAGNRPVTIRTFDGGADKPLQGYDAGKETNPFMGLRGIRLALKYPELLKTQLRALSRAAVKGNLRVLLPMVTEPAEVNQVRELLIAEVKQLTRSGVNAIVPSLGIMVEVPSVALRIAAFKADFFSIGTNDLIQFITGASRDNSEIAHLQNPANPAVIELIRRVSAYGTATGKEVSICGDMAGMTEHLTLTLNAGIKILSVSPSAVTGIKKALMQWRKM